MFFWIVLCTRHFLVTRPILDTLRPRAGAAAAAEAAPGVPAVPKPAVLLRIVILSGATGSQDRFKLPATRAVTVAGLLKRSAGQLKCCPILYILEIQRMCPQPEFPSPLRTR